jgi:phosphoglucosamine mutase
MARLFGTDGVRGVANRDVTAELALDLSVAAARVLGERGEFAGHRPKAVLARDSRVSGQFLGAAVAAGLASAGVDVLDAGVLPTPAIAYLVVDQKADLGVVVSASHNPMPDNGIKFFSRGGYKLEDAVEDAIEAELRAGGERPIGAAVGTIDHRPDLADAYVAHVVTAAKEFSGSEVPLEGLTIVADCANGAASATAGEVLSRAGAAVTTIHADPTGLNINDGVGSTHLEVLASAVVEAGADFGVAFDGDADRCLAVDATGAVVDGDQIMGIIALRMKAAGELARDTLVATVMSNLGLKRAMATAGVSVVETAVGDRYVLEAMRADGLSLGGEQSGHVIVSRYATTGDGILTATLLGSVVASTATSLADLAAPIERLPQVLVNVPNVDKTRAFDDPELQAAVADWQTALGDGGRVLLRPSGTEPLVRVMVEAPTRERAMEVASAIAEIVAFRLGAA